MDASDPRPRGDAPKALFGVVFGSIIGLAAAMLVVVWRYQEASPGAGFGSGGLGLPAAVGAIAWALSAAGLTWLLASRRASRVVTMVLGGPISLLFLVGSIRELLAGNVTDGVIMMLTCWGIGMGTWAVARGRDADSIRTR